MVIRPLSEPLRGHVLLINNDKYECVYTARDKAASPVKRGRAVRLRGWIRSWKCAAAGPLCSMRAGLARDFTVGMHCFMLMRKWCASGLGIPKGLLLSHSHSSSLSLSISLFLTTRFCTLEPDAGLFRITSISAAAFNVCVCEWFIIFECRNHYKKYLFLILTLHILFFEGLSNFETCVTWIKSDVR